MRDLLTLFVEASLAKGEWLAALNVLPKTTTTAAAQHLEAQSGLSAHYHHIARILVENGNWLAALAALRCAPSPLPSPSTSPSGCTYSSAYLDARVRVYHDLLLRYYKEKTAELDGDAPPASTSPAQPASPNAAEWEKTLMGALALAAEAFYVRPPSITAGKGTVGGPSEAATASLVGTPPPPPPSSSSPPSSPRLPEEPESASAAALLTWCQAQLCAAPVTPSLSVAQKEAMMAQLRAASQAALRGAAVAHHTAASSAPSDLSALDAPAAAPSAPDAQATADHSNEARHDFQKEKTPTTARPFPATSAATEEEAKLHALLQSAHSTRNDWSIALDLLHRVPAERVTPHVFTALCRLLAKRRRISEFDLLVRTYVFPADPELSQSEQVPPLAAAPTQATAAVLCADAVVLKTIAEAFRRLRCPRLAKELLLSRPLRAHLTPSAAVPVVMVLRDAEAYAEVIEWWTALRNGEPTPRYPLLNHAKLSSYVASCVLRRARSSDGVEPKSTFSSDAGWVEALRVFESAERAAPDPALVLLFKLRLLRQVRQWEAAMQLFSEFSANHPFPEGILWGSRHNSSINRHKNSSSSSRGDHAHRATRNSTEYPTTIENVFAVLTEERAEQWLPAEALRELRQEVTQYRHPAT
ncbi:hypothetical protein ABB37_04528 [Leptomonas pyrrhocoris]|uniref:Uncharacterized protein n=1 Tax=Leptomonas pyrrhocoris TaxID=157538 RepID=A0A0M9G2P3_LEPPY|nr:hypothetical protein ABB37_04528 [Leptomonas pyrrhocoris]KPA81190.1 hypothetical protein ABB37_04528 [Leptomonas pyrrhocoris]|eukprot:XP_015659629.1 hypothetical protein ABB37_04528 [Leptomonas pyrrhocoris]